MKLKELFKNLLFLFVVCLVLLILLEIGVRLFVPDSKRKYQFDETLGAVGIPNIEFKTTTKEFGLVTHHTNSLGFVDSEHETDKGEHVYRILVLGDSWTAALQVPREDTFCKLLEKKLDEHYSEKEFETMNFGLDGIATGKEYLFLKELGLGYNPDLVVLVFNPGNDVFYNASWLSSDPTEPYFNMEDGVLKQVTQPEPFIHNEFVSLVNKQLRFPRFLYGKIRLLKGKIESLKNQIKEKEADFPGVFNVYKREYSLGWKYAWEVTKALIKETKNESQEIGADFLLVSLPRRFGVNPELWDDVLEDYPSMKNKGWDLGKPGAILEKFSQEEDINYLNLLLLFRDHVAETGEELYEDHFNSKGHELTAELMYEFLINNNFEL